MRRVRNLAVALLVAVAVLVGVPPSAEAWITLQCNTPSANLVEFFQDGWQNACDDVNIYPECGLACYACYGDNAVDFDWLVCDEHQTFNTHWARCICDVLP